MILQKEFTFDSSHLLINPSKDETWNRETYGKCYNRPSHGHTFTLLISLLGDSNSDTGMILNFSTLKLIVENNILRHLDHQYLNDVPMLKGVIPTCENMSRIIFKELLPYLPNLYCVTLYETSTSKVSCFRKDVIDEYGKEKI